MAAHQKMGELTSLPVLSWTNEVIRRRQTPMPDLFDAWPTRYLGFCDVMLMTTSDVLDLYPRKRPFFHIVDAQTLEVIIPELFNLLYKTYPDNSKEWRPFIADSMRKQEYVLRPKDGSFTDLADTARVICLVNGGNLILLTPVIFKV